MNTMSVLNESLVQTLSACIMFYKHLRSSDNDWDMEGIDEKYLEVMMQTKLAVQHYQSAKDKELSLKVYVPVKT